MVALSAPFNSITPRFTGVALPVTTALSTVGRTSTDVYKADPEPPLFNTAGVAPSSVLLFMFTITAPRCVPALMASNASLTVLYGVGPGVPAVAVTVTVPAQLETVTEAGVV